jgi:hypothetical protein
VSVCVHGLRSLQVTPSAAFACVQPVAWLQESTVHVFASSQSGGVPAAQAPARQVSTPLHALPSVHDVPSGFAGLLHSPVCGLHVPA